MHISLDVLTSKLRDSIKGRVIVPGDSDYDQARTVFYGGFDRRPLLIARPVDDLDVIRVVSLARENGLDLAVRSGGHSVAGYSTTEGGIVLDLSNMRSLDINVDQRTAWAQTGVTTGEYVAKVDKYGLTTGFGDTGSVGIGGLTLGGGVGLLVRKHGLTIDSLLAADVVTADGRLLRADNDSNPDLFWAIRGGGGNFGVATRLQLKLQEMNSILAGTLILPANPEAISAFVAEADAAPDELTTIANIMPAPPMPFIPTEWYGKLVIMASIVFAGPIQNGEKVISRFKSIGQPVADMIRVMRYPEMFPPEQQVYHPVSKSRTMFLDQFKRPEAEIAVDHLKSSKAQMNVLQLGVLGGAMSTVPVEATAFAHRNRKMMANIAAIYALPEEAQVHQTWVDTFASALNPAYGAYVNFLGDEGEARVQEAYPGSTFERLRSVKRHYDPTNLFHLNQNIPPAEEGEHGGRERSPRI